MTTLEWQESLAIGVIDIDMQHKLLFDKFNTFLNACRNNRGADEINRLFWFLEAYTLTHFQQEERLMQEIAYPDFLSHRESHLAFAKEVQVLKARLKDEGVAPDLLSSATTFVSTWLQHHISNSDRALGNFTRL